MKKQPKDIGASVRARLLQRATDRQEDFQLILTRYVNERLLYRLANSAYASKFVLKGAALFTLWGGEPHRPTRDLDLLGYGEPSTANIESIFKDILSLEVEEDGVEFGVNELSVCPIREHQQYGGLRVVLPGYLTTARLRVQVDVGFGDTVTPDAQVETFPVLLNLPSPRLRVYPPETVVAEKLEAMVKLDFENSRMKDLYDLAALSRMFNFQGEVLVRAIAATFGRRRTPLPLGLPTALTYEFYTNASKMKQWSGFLRKSRKSSPRTLEEVAGIVTRFVGEPLAAASENSAFRKTWPCNGPWLDTRIPLGR